MEDPDVYYFPKGTSAATVKAYLNRILGHITLTDPHVLVNDRPVPVELQFSPDGSYEFDIPGAKALVFSAMGIVEKVAEIALFFEEGGTGHECAIIDNDICWILPNPTYMPKPKQLTDSSGRTTVLQEPVNGQLEAVINAYLGLPL